MAIVINKTAAEFFADNDLLNPNQIGFESDTGLTKVGYGLWNSMDYYTPIAGAFEQVLSGLTYKVPSSKAVTDAIAAIPTPTLAQVLAAGNFTDSNDIHIKPGQAIYSTGGAYPNMTQYQYWGSNEVLTDVYDTVTQFGGQVSAFSGLTYGGVALVSYNNITGYSTGFEVGNNSIIIQSSNPGFKGILYPSDISANYTIRSLIDKGYAAATFAPIGITLAQVLANGRNVDATGTIKTSTGAFSIDVNNGTLSSPVLLIGTVDWNNAQLSNSTGIVEDWNAQIFYGNWTSNGNFLFVSGVGIDTTATGGSDVLNIGATNANVINYGNSTTIHNFLGTAIYELQINSYVQDKLITLNYGGALASGIGVGFEIQENSAITGYIKTNAARSGFSFLAPANTAATTLIFQASTAKDVTFQDVTGTVYVSTGTDVTLADGGTNASLVASNGGIFYSTNTAGAILAGTATAGQMLRSGASSAPSWSTATFPSTAASAGTILRADGTNWVASTATYPNTVGANELMYGTGANVFGSSANLTYSGLILSVGGATNSSVQAVATASGTTGEGIVYATNTTNGAYTAIEAFGSASALTFFGVNRTGMSALMMNPATGGIGAVGTFSNFALLFGTNNTERARFLTTGEYLIGRTTLFSAASFLEVQKDRNAATAITVYNATSGTAASAQFVGYNAAGRSFGLMNTSALYTTSGMFEADGTILTSNSLATMNIGNTTNIPIKFWTNATQKAVIEAAGNFAVGTTASISTNNIGNFRIDVNATTYLSVVNATSGTSAVAGLVTTASATAATETSIYACSAGRSTSGLFGANLGVLVTNQTGGLNIGAISNTAVSFYTNNVHIARFLSSGEFILGGTATALINTEYFSIQKNQNASTHLRIQNTNASSGAFAEIAFGNGTAVAGSGINGTGTTGGGLFGTANLGYAYSNNAAGFAVGASNASGPLLFYSGGSATANERGRFLSTGELLIGYTALASTEIAGVQKNQNAITKFLVTNTTSGTAGKAWVQVSNSSTAATSVLIGSNSASITNNGLQQQDAGELLCDKANGLYIGTTNSALFALGTNNAIRITISSAGLTTWEDALNLAFGTTTGTKIGTATNQKLGIWNTAPIVQPTNAIAAAAFVANTSAIANDTATFDGYTLGQVVKALRNFGLLA